MKFAQSIGKMWKTRDELSPRNFRACMWPVLLVLPLTVMIGDLRFFDQELVLLGVDSNSLMMMVFGLGFLPVLFMKEQYTLSLLRISVFVQIPLFAMQLFMGPGVSRLFVYLAFHAVNGVSTACGFYLFAFLLNNVERLFTMVFIQSYYALTYLFLKTGPALHFFRTVGSVAVVVALAAVVCIVKIPFRQEKTPAPRTNARESGIAVIIALNMVYYVITLMAMYIEYQETTVSSALYGIGGLAAVAVIFVIMLVFNYSALHLWSLCLVCSVLGIGALHYATGLAVNAGSLFYGMGEGLGCMIIFYLQGGALKRSGSFRLFQLCCLFTGVHYVVVSGVFYVLYSGLNATNLALAFPAVLVLALICFLFAPVLHDTLFRTDWTDGYHMADMPLYAQTLEQVEQIDNERVLGLTPREMEVFTMLLTEASPKQIADVLKISMGTFNFHSTNLYRKLNIQSRAELFAGYADTVSKKQG